jgi:hypothetical protein
MEKAYMSIYPVSIYFEFYTISIILARDFHRWILEFDLWNCNLEDENKC